MVLNLIKSITYAWSAARRAWIYRDWLAHDVDYDWAPLAKIMEIKLRRMSRVFSLARDSSYHNISRDCKVAAELLKRIREERYSIQQYLNKVPENDNKLLGKLIGHKLRCWW